MSKKGIYFFFEREKIFTFAKKISYRSWKHWRKKFL